MIVTVSSVGYLKLEGMGDDGAMSLNEGATIGDLLTRAGIRPEHHRFITASVNGEQRRLSHALEDGDRVSLFMPVGGG